MSGIEQLSQQALADIAGAQSPEALEALRVGLLGKHGSITAQLKALGSLPADQRKQAGEAINRARDALSEALAARKTELDDAAVEARLATETIDITLPGRHAARGGLHPVTRTLERITGIFGRMGYALADGPEIEDDWHNFEALNFPPHHPARAMHDTFYFGDGRLLRTYRAGDHAHGELGVEGELPQQIHGQHPAPGRRRRPGSARASKLAIGNGRIALVGPSFSFGCLCRFK